MGRLTPDGRDHFLQRGLRPDSGEVRDLRFECAGDVRRRGDDRAEKRRDRVGIA